MYTIFILLNKVKVIRWGKKTITYTISFLCSKK